MYIIYVQEAFYILNVRKYMIYYCIGKKTYSDNAIIAYDAFFLSSYSIFSRRFFST